MKFAFIILAMIILLAACSSEPVQSVSQIPNTSTAIPKLTQTLQPSQTPRPLIPNATSTPLSPVESTVEAFGTICESPARDAFARISPDGLWIAMVCMGKYGVIDSHLRVVSIQGDKDWSIHYADYAEGTEYYDDDMVSPFYWSVDGNYLFATSYSRVSGCCWIGYNLFLIRLNLENGEQTEILNYAGDGVQGVSLSISSNERYVSYIPQDFENNLYIIDLYTLKNKLIQLQDTGAGAGHVLMSNNNKKSFLCLDIIQKNNRVT